jgi:hypothetical protein
VPNAYEIAWKEYRTRQILAITATVAFFVLPVLVGSLTNEGYSRNLALGLLILVLFIAVFVFGWRLAFWPCPRCGKAFRGFSDRCRHCACRCGRRAIPPPVPLDSICSDLPHQLFHQFGQGGYRRRQSSRNHLSGSLRYTTGGRHKIEELGQPGNRTESEPNSHMAKELIVPPSPSQMETVDLISDNPRILALPLPYQ